MHPVTHLPLVVTGDLALREELARLAAAAGTAVDLVPTAEDALTAWSHAPAVLVGSDQVGPLLDLQPARRPGVQVVTWAPAPPGTFRDALLVGAERVAELPAGAELVAELLTDLDEAGRPDAVVVGVLGGSGGAGATTFACALAQVAAARGPALVVDLDPRGPGCDRLLGVEDRAGVRWDTVGTSSGRLSGRSLREAVPRRDGVGVLAWPAAVCPVDPAAVREALSAARRGHDTVAVDLPRTGEVAGETLARCALVVAVVVPTVTGVASAARTVAALPDPDRVGLVVRGRGADPQRVEVLVGAPVLAVMADQRGLAEALDLGLGPVRSRRGPLARAARRVLPDAGRAVAAA